MIEETKGSQRRWIGLLFLGLSLLVIALDNTILNLALPSISDQLGASASQLQWIVDSYILVFAAMLLTMGSLGDRLGRKKLLQAGLLFFGICSLAAALSTSTNMLIVSRALMGLGGATIMPATLSILTATFRDPKERAQAIALWAATFALGAGIGPVIGGVLLDHFSWSSVFYINVPIVIIAIIGDYFMIENSKDEKVAKPDYPGVLLSIAGLFALVYGIIQAGESSWGANDVVASLISAAVLLSVFGWWERRTPHAMLPFRFFKNMSFTGANAALTLVMFSLFGSMFFLSQYLQSVLGYTPLEAGVRLLPMAFTSFLAALMSARVAGFLGTKFTVAVGILLAGSGMFYLSVVAQADSSYSTVLVGMCIAALGIGTTMSPATNSIMGALPVSRAGVGSAMNDTNRQVGGALGVAILGTIMNATYIDKVDHLKETNQMIAALPHNAFEAIRSSIQGAQIVAQHIPDPQLAQEIINTTSQAFTSGMKEGLLIGAIIMWIASFITLLILPQRVRASEEEKGAS